MSHEAIHDHPTHGQAFLPHTQWSHGFLRDIVVGVLRAQAQCQQGSCPCTQGVTRHYHLPSTAVSCIHGVLERGLELEV